MTDTIRAAVAYLAAPRSGQPFTTDVQQRSLGMRYRQRLGRRSRGPVRSYARPDNTIHVNRCHPNSLDHGDCNDC